MHPKISINTLCLGAASLGDHIDTAAGLGAAAIGPGLEEVVQFGASSTRRRLDDAGLTVATLTHRAFGFATPQEAIAGRERLDATIAVAEAIGAQTITLITGGRGTLNWSDAAERFAAEIMPSAARARDAGVTLSLEPTSHLYADSSIAHRLADTVAVARGAGIGVGIDLFACWVDADIEEAIAAAGPDIALVQVSDYVLGDRALPCRAVPGDGAIPLDRLLPAILATGFDGWFDLEIIGPRLADEGVEQGVRRAMARVGEILERGPR